MKHKVGGYVCETCNKAFAYKKNYDEHCLTHDMEQISTMSATGTAADISSATKHLKTHACIQCGKSYKRKDHLKRHELVHTGERPHVCLICMKSFVRKDKLTRHENIHFKDKRHQFVCPDCKKTFLRKDSFDKHRRKTHGDILNRENAKRMPMAKGTLEESDRKDFDRRELQNNIETVPSYISEPYALNASSSFEHNASTES